MGDREGRKFLGEEEEEREFHQVQCYGGVFIAQGAHGANPWYLRPPDEGGRQGRGRSDHIYGVLPQVVAGDCFSSVGESVSSS